jgi:AcrR family transcriptional regulator
MAVQDKRQSIMRAAEKLFRTRRIHEITLDEVTQIAHVGKGTIYQHFEDKDDLFFQVATSGFDDLCALIQKKVSGAAPFRQQALEMCEAIGAYFEGRREMFRVIQAEEARLSSSQGRIFDRWLEHRKKLILAMAGVVARGQAEGLLRNDIDSETLALFLLGMLRTRLRDLKDARPSVQGYELLIDLFVNGGKAQEIKK